MEYGSEFGYGAVNVEGFAVGSIMNQGFADYKINTISGEGALKQSSLGSEITIEVEAEYDQSKLTLKWAVDGVVQSNYYVLCSCNCLERLSAYIVDLRGDNQIFRYALPCALHFFLTRFLANLTYLF